MSAIKKLFRRKKAVPLACSISLDDEQQHEHVHTDACFLDIQPLSVVELFQSQSCASCPPSIPGIQSASMGPNLLLLTYDVTYFDHTGWADTFASRQWDNRQKAYLRKWGRNNVFTPQVIVDGLADGTGANGEVPSIVTAARQFRTSMPWHIIVDANDTDLKIDSDRPAPPAEGEAMSMMNSAPGMMGSTPAMMDSAPGMMTSTPAMMTSTPAMMTSTPANNDVFDINLIYFDTKQQTVKVGKGPNKGKKIVHGNLVKGIYKLGEWKGGNAMLSLPAAEQLHSLGYAGLEAVAVVQGQNGGGIVAAQRL